MFVILFFPSSFRNKDFCAAVSWNLKVDNIVTFELFGEWTSFDTCLTSLILNPKNIISALANQMWSIEIIQQAHRMAEFVRNIWKSPVLIPAQGAKCRAGYPGPCPDRYIKLILFKLMMKCLLLKKNVKKIWGQIQCSLVEHNLPYFKSNFPIQWLIIDQLKHYFFVILKFPCESFITYWTEIRNQSVW